MPYRILTGIILSVLLMTVFSFSQSKEEKRLASADETFQSIASEIPDTILNKAAGFAIVPNIVRGGAGVTGFQGYGILSFKMQNGCWSNPSFISFRDLSVGLQGGGENTDVVLVFMTERGINAFADGKVELGSGVTVLQGPVRSNEEAGKNADVYYYARSDGAFAGESFDGASISIDDTANENYYGSGDLSFDKFRLNQIAKVPESADDFKKILVKIAGGC
jgi:lipid-binding SYLF domain-containing protein